MERRTIKEIILSSVGTKLYLTYDGRVFRSPSIRDDTYLGICAGYADINGSKIENRNEDSHGFVYDVNKLGIDLREELSWGDRMVICPTTMRKFLDEKVILSPPLTEKVSYQRSLSL